MTQKWNLQDIQPARPSKPARQRRTEPTPAPTIRQQAENNETSLSTAPVKKQPAPNMVIRPPKRISRNFRTKIVPIGAVLLLVGADAVVFGGFFDETTLTVYPEHRTVPVSATIAASRDAQPNTLPYELLTITQTTQTQVPATGRVEVESAASGEISISKNTPGSERLIKNTRFRSPDGLIFRITESVVVPGSTTDSNGNVVPGTITASVFADDIGADYNLIANTLFDIPGFQEGGFTELFESISASNATAFSGGYVGPQFEIADETLETARAAMQKELHSSLLAELQTQQPTGSVIFPNSEQISFQTIEATEVSSEMVSVQEQGVLQVPVFTEASLAEYLANATISTYDDSMIRITDPNDLTFAHTSTTESPFVTEPFSFTLTGTPIFVWEYDEQSLRNDLSGLPKSALRNVITAYDSIAGAQVTMKPFWRTRFPVVTEDIEISEEIKTGIAQ